MDFINLFESSKLNSIICEDNKNSTVSHAYMLCGQDELYLNYLAKELARKLITKTHNESCTCPTCQKINGEVHADVLMYPRQGELIVVDDINQIVEQSFVYPLEGDKKVFILKNFDSCTIQAQNKLLKTLEEPNEYVAFVITTTVPSSVLPTIKSRTKMIDIEPLGNEELKNFLLKNSRVKVTDANLFVASAAGNLTRLVNLTVDPDYLKIKELVLNTFVELNSSSDILKFSSTICAYKGRLPEILDEFALLVRDLSLVKSGQEQMVLGAQNINKLKACNYSVKALNEIMKLITLSSNKLKSNCNPNACVDGLLMGMLEARYKWK